MGFMALIYVETLTPVDGTNQMVRETDPRGANFVFGSATGSSPTRDAFAGRLHREYNLAANQRVTFIQTERAIPKRIDRAIAKAKEKGQILPWLNAYRLVKSRLRPKRRHQQHNST